MQQEPPQSELNPVSQERPTNIDLDRNLSGYDYDLPESAIAQNPVVPRDRSRLLVVDSPLSGEKLPPVHTIFHNLPEILQPGDLLVMNNTKVIPARLYGRKSTGATVEVLLLEELSRKRWLALVKPGRRFKLGSQIIFEAGRILAGDEGWKDEDGKEEEEDEETAENGSFPPMDGSQPHLIATVVDTDPVTGGRVLEFTLPSGTSSLIELLGEFGQIPLPPYIKGSSASDDQYQTVYAQNPGSVAAPTAGLHFTPELIERLQQVGIERAFVTLHVGIGTFRPVEVTDVTNHLMHEEWIEIPPQTVEKIQATLAGGGRIIAVGTTVVRTLEGAANQLGELKPYCGKTNLFIYPGYQWRVIDGLITNFHLPRSSLMMLVSALVGRQRLLNLYQEAIKEKYRFYSFGDAMLILPEGRSD